MQFPCSGNTAPHLAAVKQSVARKHDRIFCIGLICREIIEFRMVARLVLCNFFRRIEFVRNLCSCIIRVDQKVHPSHTAVDGFFSDHIQHRIVVFAAFQQSTIPLPDIYIGVNARPLDAGVFAQFLHRGLRGDVGFALFPFGKGGQGQYQNQAEQHGQPSQDVFHWHPPFRCPGPERTSPPTGLSSCSARAKAARVFFYCSTTGRFRKGISDKKERLPREASAPGGQLPGRRAVFG